MKTTSYPSSSNSWALVLACFGVVYGDIGTSPLYTIRECIDHATGIDQVHAVFGSLSLISMALIFVVSFKYINYITKADNHGEGGIFALLALLPAHKKTESKIPWTAIIALAGAALLYGDGIITPSISVLSAAEGLKALSPEFTNWVISISCVLLTVLFWVQHHGTGRIGKVFGPIMIVWFTVLGFLGARQILAYPEILQAMNPKYGIFLLFHYPRKIFGVLGAVVLAITGAEALYADLGHFGRKAVVTGWYSLVLPGLLLNYFGQGAYVLHNPQELDNLFFALAPPGMFRFLLVGLSVIATIIASQALISGTFSLTRQAIQLGYFPRLHILHTSADQEGQIYLPIVNLCLAIGCLALVIGFGSSGRLASAYGIAVTGTMAATTIAFFKVARSLWKWTIFKTVLLCAVFLLVDAIFFISNLQKLMEGGWLPLGIGAFLLVIMLTWKKGRDHILSTLYAVNVDPAEIIKDIQQNHLPRVPGSAVFMSANPEGTPIVLLHHLKANKCLHETVILLSFVTESVPRVLFNQRLEIKHYGRSVWRAVARYGYMQSPSAFEIISLLEKLGAPIEIQDTTFYFNRETILYKGKAKMWRWQKSLYALLSRNARPPSHYYEIPANQIIEIGLPVNL
jgi:KUP system potassium uptake protein